MTDHPALHDPHYYEPYNLDNMPMDSHTSIRTIEEMISEHGSVFLYSPDHERRGYGISENDDGTFCLESYKIIGYTGNRPVIDPIEILGSYADVDEIIEDFPEIASQTVFEGTYPILH